MGNKGEKEVWGEDGLWQQVPSTSIGASVNSMYWVKTGCYQTFKAESIRLMLQQGKRR